MGTAAGPTLSTGMRNAPPESGFGELGTNTATRPSLRTSLSMPMRHAPPRLASTTDNPLSRRRQARSPPPASYIRNPGPWRERTIRVRPRFSAPGEEAGKRDQQDFEDRCFSDGERDEAFASYLRALFATDPPDLVVTMGKSCGGTFRSDIEVIASNLLPIQFDNRKARGTGNEQRKHSGNDLSPKGAFPAWFWSGIGARAIGGAGAVGGRSTGGCRDGRGAR
jgi:hypothetical protein